ncbi:hypothetical protein LTR05_007383 [Lithohypha guttulata]|uniref:DAGKc domain-containing protein n=1 Tax=Lithohypha guttulata TaxID=1690604 RepID=A0AAN7YDX8_9EURO|nr:hypothetical protein LTR05_007383 [Lithohypha guttulata]
MAEGRHPLPAHLSPDREVHVIISTGSGDQTAQTFYDTTLQPYLAVQCPHLELKKNHFIHTTISRTSITELTTKLFLFNAKKGVKNTILLLSGDGGIVDLVNTLTTTLQREIDDVRPPSIFFKPIIVLFPCGTANALAHSAGIVRKGPLDVLMTGRARPLPQFEVKFSRAARLVADEGRQRLEFDQPGPQNERSSGEIGYYDPEGDVRIYGCVVFSWGLHASLVALSDTAEMRQHGVERFKMAAGELLQEGHIYSGTVKYKSNGGPWQNLEHKSNSGQDGANTNKHRYILATQVRNLEEKFCISPQSQPMDGTLRLLAIGDQSSDTIMKILTLAYENGKHVEEFKDSITYQEIDSLRIEFDEPEESFRQVCVDGKIVAIEQGGWVEVRKMSAGGINGRRVVELVS